VADRQLNWMSPCFSKLANVQVNASIPGFRREERVAISAQALYEIKNRELVRQHAAVTVDDEFRVISLVEKPAEPETTLI